ncbi:tetratricopeptide repeat protein [Methylohalobius crimeensis]|uniref:tetratricopeptide repeat protein n=1 Tax=Methylohalobius crimeensis TaxID=244365 RepID=UPI0003B61BD7|nr:tetratricopeptide repeat protein [Methylohalobius crimeensis]
MVKWTPLICLLAHLFVGCGLQRPSLFARENATAPPSARACRSDTDADKDLKLDLIRKLMDEGKLYAALAHLDAVRSKTPQAIYLRAEILRRTDRADQAIPWYRLLLDSCMGGWGRHGLGLIAGRANRIGEALDHLQRAKQSLPTVARVRNDLGYALLRAGRYASARNEFLTALELDGGNSLAATNLTMLLALMGHDREMRAFAARMHMDGATLNRLRAQAEALKAAGPPRPPSKPNPTEIH